MKKNFFSLFFIFCISLVYGIEDSIKSNIVIHRESSFFSAIDTLSIMVNGSIITNIDDDLYYIFNCESGKCNIGIKDYQNVKVNLDIKKGETYYLRIKIKNGFRKSIPERIIIDSISSNINANNIQNIFDNKMSRFKSSKNMFGVNFISGFGYNETKIYDGKISLGGGYGIGVKYGYDLSKYLNIAISYNYQHSSFLVEPSFFNVFDIFFTRHYISLTPNYIVYLNKKGNFKFKFGCGLDKYWNSNIEFKVVNPMWNAKDDLWKYSSTIGYHFNLELDLKYTENWSLNFLSKYNNVKYKFENSEIYNPYNQELKILNGESFNFVLGFYYHF